MGNAEDLVTKAQQFATALDACDYATAAEFLASECAYRISEADSRIGPAAILDAYRQSDEKARRQFDYVKYSSVAATEGSHAVRLTFLDELRYGEFHHVFRCSQLVYFGVDEKIERIELMQIPGERERLKEFCDRHTIRFSN